MNVSETSRRRRLRRRLFLGTAIGAGVAVMAAQQASAATSATFANGVLTVSGDNAGNTVTVSRNAAGAILVNGGAVRIIGGTPTVANTTLIQVFGLNGNDTLSLDEINGALPKASMFGGAGSDTIVGGSGSDQLFGQGGNDVLLGKGGFDLLFGGENNDTLTGGDADDQAFGQGGHDRMVWNPGDDTDLNEGGAGTDTVEVNGGNGTEQFATTANGARVRFDRIDPAPFAIDIGTSERLALNANGGDDSFAATGNLAALILITADGGTGNDQLLGSNGVDVLFGGDGNDVVDGQQGDDVAFLGAGDDVFQWDPGDGNDVIEGQADTDTMQFNGSAANEIMEASANGQRLRFTRNIANIVMDTDDVEVVDVNALGGTDVVTVGDLSGTDVARLDTDLAGVLGTAGGDAQPDTVIVNGTNGDDVIDVFGSGTSAAVVGLQAQVNVLNAEGATDSLVLNALGGDDGVTATTLPAGVVELTIDGGAGNDSLLGSQAADVFVGGDGDEFVFGDNGDDLALMGAGDDVFQWDPGDGNDVLEGQAGTDTMLFFGANASENIDVSANGGRVRFFRDIAGVTMDLDDVERIDVRALGGADNIVVGDLSGTDVAKIGTDLRGPAGGADGQADTVTVNGTQGADTFGAAGDTGGVDVFGLPTVVDVFFQEQALDRVTLNGLGGDDVIDATSLEADGVQLTMNGGLGTDLFLGSEGDDLVSGGDGDDVALMSAGDDTFVWNPGDDNDTLEGQSGTDTMLFNGANIAENVDVSANGGRVRLSRNVANVVMDLNDVERVDFRALGGADNVVVGDLSGTDVVDVNTDLGAADGQPDAVVVRGTNGDDVVVAAGDASITSVFGLAAQVNVTAAEAANDRLTVHALAGDDVVDASGLAAGAIQFTGDGGDGNDVVIGGDGNDVLLGGAGDDVLLGGAGNDVVDGGDGDDIEIQSIRNDTVTSASAADARWFAQHARIVEGATVLEVGGKQQVLPNADLSTLVQDVTTS